MDATQSHLTASLLPRLLQRQQSAGRAPLPRGSAGRFGFAFNSMDRPNYTLMTLASLDTEPGFDLVWVDGSRTQHSQRLVQQYRFRHTRVVESHLFVRGGPDRAIQFGLKRLLALGYDWCGLIENDIVFLPGWFSALKGVIDRATQAGIAVGAASIRAYVNRVAEFRDGYSIDWATGAGMVVFHREAAQLIVDHYDELEYSLGAMRDFYRSTLGISLDQLEYYRRDLPLDRPFTMDWGYAPFLYQHHLTTIGSVPSCAYDLEYEVRRHLSTRYAQPADSGAGIRTPLVSP